MIFERSSSMSLSRIPHRVTVLPSGEVVSEDVIDHVDMVEGTDHVFEGCQARLLRLFPRYRRHRFECDLIRPLLIL